MFPGGLIHWKDTSGYRRYHTGRKDFMDKMHACPSHNHNNHCNDLIPPADQTFRPPDSALRLYQLISIAFNFQGFLSKIHILPCKRDNDFISCICGNHRLQKSLSDCLLLSLTQPSSESRIVSDAVREWIDWLYSLMNRSDFCHLHKAECAKIKHGSLGLREVRNYENS